MATTFELPEELYRRLADVAAERGVSARQLIVDVLSRQFQSSGDAQDDPFEAFIGGFDSGDPDWASTDTAVLRQQAAARRAE